MRLDPHEAATLASEIYDIFGLKSVKDAFVKFNGKYSQHFEFKADYRNNLITTRVGGPGILKSKMAFGAHGFGKGPFKGHAFIVLRGTKTTPEMITNLNIGFSRAANKQSVHDGFNTAFKKGCQRYVNAVAKEARRRNIHSIHCIGHSLGGALATLAADYLSANYDMQPYLYTFGGPRTGTLGFAQELTRRLRPERIFRVYNRTDIVPCVPPFPYVHAPLGAGSVDYQIPGVGGVFPSSKWHGHTIYATSLEGSTWDSLRSHAEQRLSKNEIKRWLEKDSPIAFTISNVKALDAVVNYVIQLSLKATGVSFAFGFGTGFTIFDWTARVAKEGLKLTGEVSYLVFRLIIRIMQILGMKPIADKVEATEHFIRHIFILLHQRLMAYAQKAFDQAVNKGRGL